MSVAEGEFPSFDEFTVFIKEEATIACNPVSSYTAINKKKEPVTVSKEKQPQSKIVKHSSFATNTDNANSGDVKSNEEKPDTKKNVVPICIYCNENHDIEKCQEFLKLSLSRMNEYLEEKRLCKGCFRVGHIFRLCKRRRKCNKCKR